MKQKTTMINVCLAIVLGLGLLGAMAARAFAPGMILPGFGIPEMAGICLIALLVDYFFVGVSKRSWIIEIILAAVTFYILPLAAGLITSVKSVEGFKMAGIGTLVFAVTSFLFWTSAERSESTYKGKLSMIVSSLMIYLACQCFMGLI